DPETKPPQEYPMPGRSHLAPILNLPCIRDTQLVERCIPSPIKLPAHGAKWKPPHRDISVDNADIISLLLRRVNVMEQEFQELKRQVAVKDDKIVELQEDLDELKLQLFKDTADGEPVDRFPFDMSLVSRQIHELNIEAGDGQSTVVVDESGASVLKARERLPLVIYQNGILVKGGPFRSFRLDPTSLAFVRDIQDGYYPFELQASYPDGVPFDFEDRHDECYPPLAARDAVRETAAVPASSANEAFLAKLPKYVIRAGNVVHMREDIRSLFSSVEP
ncbi:UBX domain-containing protein 11, partial [Kappamyces sp. JEL0680]